jgi:hypothetical protein
LSCHWFGEQGGCHLIQTDFWPFPSAEFGHFGAQGISTKRLEVRIPTNNATEGNCIAVKKNRLPIRKLQRSIKEKSNKVANYLFVGLMNS